MILQRFLHEPIETVLDEQLGNLRPEQQFDALLQLLNHLLSLDAPLERAIGTCWNRIYNGQLWKDRHESLEDFKQYIRFDTAIKPVLLYKDNIDYRKALSIRKIKKSWGGSLEDILPASAIPARLSKYFLDQMAVLSSMCSCEDAVKLLKGAVANRKRRSRRLNPLSLQAADIQQVIQHLRGTSPQSMFENTVTKCRSRGRVIAEEVCAASISFLDCRALYHVVELPYSAGQSAYRRK